MYRNGFYMVGMHGLWWIFWLVLLGAVVVYVWRRPDDADRRQREPPQELLRRRLATGEITPQQYEERKALLDRDTAGRT